MAVPPPLAAGLNGIEGILTLLFLLFWIVSQVRALFGGADRGRAAAPAAPRRPAPEPDDETRRELARQIEEFMRRTTGERTGPTAAQRRERSGRPRGSGVAVPAPGGRRPAQPARGDARPRRPGAVPAIASLEQPPALGSLGGHAADVARHVDDAFAREMPHLPAGAAAPAAETPAAPVAATGIAALLRDPATLRQLVIVREVLDRPVDRW